ncbi:DNA repair protein RecO [Litorivivens sp.]|uniref:DNA repair protein RecO n=1 Tax=Litorivivens sp. TaxID=2020868 RepID=UPI003565CF4C
MESDFEPAYLLHARPYRDTQLIIECFSREHGRLAAVARGVKGGGKRARELAAALQPFQLLEIRWRGHGELKTLVDVESRQPLRLAGNSLFCALYVNEITLRALHRLDAHPLLWSGYETALKTMADCSAKDNEALQVILRRYELQLLAELGYGLDFYHDTASGAPIAAQARYKLSNDGGFYQVPAADQGYLGADLLALAQALEQSATLDQSKLRDLKRICRQALVPLVGAAPFKSRALFTR